MARRFSLRFAQSCVWITAWTWVKPRCVFFDHSRPKPFPVLAHTSHEDFLVGHVIQEVWGAYHLDLNLPGVHCQPLLFWRFLLYFSINRILKMLNVPSVPSCPKFLVLSWNEEPYSRVSRHEGFFRDLGCGVRPRGTQSIYTQWFLWSPFHGQCVETICHQLTLFGL